MGHRSTNDPCSAEPEFTETELYTGNVDQNGLRHGTGVQNWFVECRHKYVGTFVQDALHVNGTYVIQGGTERAGYSGQIYANDLESYGKFCHSDGVSFEGLYKNNRRFGPGVLTNADGTQEVGLWDCDYLCRLSETVNPHWVPRLAYTLSSKSKLLKFRKLVRICNEEKPKPLRILERLGANSAILDKQQELYSVFVRNKKSNFFNKELYDGEFFDAKDCVIEVAIMEDVTPPPTPKEGDSDTREYSPPTKMVAVSDLLAWNNEQVFVEMLKHTFLHRYSEKRVSFKIADVLSGKRGEFAPAGPHEVNCIQFLKECSNGRSKVVANHLMRHNINPDICDAKGNSGIMYASARDRAGVIKTLLNLGANIDFENDECLTPLNMCILRYLAIKYEVTDWEKAFIPHKTILKPEEEEQVNEWRPHVSLISLSNPAPTGPSIGAHKPKEAQTEMPPPLRKSLMLSSVGDQSGMDESSQDSFYEINLKLQQMQLFQELRDFQEPYCREPGLQEYILSTEYPKRRSVKKDNRTSYDLRMHSVSKLFSSNLSENILVTNLEKIKESLTDQEDQRLNVIYHTIMTLLKSGADVNYAQTPLPTLILSVFCKNPSMVHDILACKANPNVTTLDENLTSLHVAVSLPFCDEITEICDILLESYCDPNLRTSTYHWLEQKELLLGGRSLQGADEGKTPLHILAMRIDYGVEANENMLLMAEALIRHGADCSQVYLGHTPLSLAVLKGNVSLIELLCKMCPRSPNEPLGESMGVALTVLILKRYENALEADKTNLVFSTLIDNFANPLNPVEGFGNAVEYMNEEHWLVAEHERRASESKTVSKTSRSTKLSIKTASSSKTGKSAKKQRQRDPQQQVKEQLLNSTREVLLRRVACNATKYLYYFAFDDSLDEEPSEALAKYLTPNTCAKYLQLLIHSGVLPITTTTKSLTLKVISYVSQVHKLYHRKEGEDASKLSIHWDPNEFMETIEIKRLNKDKRAEMLENYAELDSDYSKYQVCLHCCCRTNKDLILCPKCYMIYFCSKQCNALCNKTSKVHPCNILFYDKEKKARQERIERGEPAEAFNLLQAKVKAIEEKLWKLAEESKFSRGRERERTDERAKFGKKGRSTRDKSAKTDDEEKYPERQSKVDFLGLYAATTRSQSTRRTKRKRTGGKSRSPTAKGYRSSPSRGRRVRISNKFEYFLNKLSELLPDFDLAMLFFPYVCFNDGQLYYRFCSTRPLFAETYSSV